MDHEFYVTFKIVNGSVLYAFPAFPLTCHSVVSIVFAKVFIVVEKLQLEIKCSHIKKIKVN